MFIVFFIPLVYAVDVTYTPGTMALKHLVLMAILKFVLPLPDPDPDINIHINARQIVNGVGCCPGPFPVKPTVTKKPTTTTKITTLVPPTTTTTKKTPTTTPKLSTVPVKPIVTKKPTTMKPTTTTQTTALVPPTTTTTKKTPTTTPKPITGNCPIDWNPVDGKCYQVHEFDDSLTLMNAYLRCKTDKAALTRPGSDVTALNNFIREAFPELTSPYWFGRPIYMSSWPVGGGKIPKDRFVIGHAKHIRQPNACLQIPDVLECIKPELYICENDPCQDSGVHSCPNISEYYMEEFECEESGAHNCPYAHELLSAYCEPTDDVDFLNRMKEHCSRSCRFCEPL